MKLAVASVYSNLLTVYLLDQYFSTHLIMGLISHSNLPGVFGVNEGPQIEKKRKKIAFKNQVELNNSLLVLNNSYIFINEKQ